MLKRYRVLALAGLLVLGAAGRAAEFNLGVRTEDVRLGKVLLGKLDKKDLEGRVVLLEFWGINCGPCLLSLPKVAALNSELGPFGVVVVGAHAQGGPPSRIVARAKSRGVNFPIVQSAEVVKGMDFGTIPHCMLFSHTGRCLFRGHPNRVEKPLREAAAAALADAAAKQSPGPVVGQLVVALRRGSSPAEVLREALPLLKAKDAGTAADAAKLVGLITAGGGRQLDEAEGLKETEPLRALDVALSAASLYEGSPVGERAGKLLEELKKNAAVEAELKARPILESVRKLDATLTARAEERTLDPSSEEFRKGNSFHLRQLGQRLAQIERAAPDSAAAAAARDIAARYGVGKR